MTKNLTRKHQRFVDELAGDPRLSAAEAARRAGYSERCAAQTGHELLNSPKYAHVQTALQKAQEACAKKVDADPDEIHAALQSWARMEPPRLYTVDPATGETRARPLNELSAQEASWIREVKVTTTPYGQVVNYKLHSAFEARRIQAKSLGMLKDKLEISGAVLAREEVTRLAESTKAKLQSIFLQVEADNKRERNAVEAALARLKAAVKTPELLADIASLTRSLGAEEPAESQEEPAA